MSRTRVGLICCLSFVLLEAFQAVYLGALFQEVDSFLVGALVFGISAAGSVVATLLFRRAELTAALNSIKVIAGLNFLAAVTWTTYFIAIQLIEPAVVFALFSGMVPLGTALAATMGVREAFSFGGNLDRLGNGLILVSLLLLAGTTVAGMSGFVRGDISVALLGVVLSAISGFCTALLILYSVRLNRRGVGPLAQFGLRFVLYTMLCVLAFSVGVDDKAVPISLSELWVIVAIGLIVIALPLYLLQKAVPLLPARTIAAMTALGPVMVFMMQLMEGRVSYAPATLVGLLVYVGGAFIAAIGVYRSGKKTMRTLHG